jgi:hypothetical protein
LVFLNGSNSNELYICNITVTNITVVNTEGGFGAILNGLKATILSSSFDSVGIAERGGVFVFENILEPVIITQCLFSNSVSVSNGGALSFLSNITFQIENSNFTSCISTRGYGGALASSSTMNGIREFKNCHFAENLAYHFLGLDIYDDSNKALDYYTNFSVINSSSSSYVIGEYLLFVGTTVFFLF